MGRLLLEQWDKAAAEEWVFDIVGHLNLGSGLITDEAERLALARLDLAAGRKAKSSTAYQAALGYLNAGIGLLGEDRWGSDYDLMLGLHLEAAECEYLCGYFDEAERNFETLLNTATMVRLSLVHGNIEESAHAYVLHAMLLGPVRGEYRSAYETGLFADAAYALFNETYFILLAGPHLRDLRPVCESSIGFIKRVKMHAFADAPQVILQWGLALEGSTASSVSLTGAGFDEAEYRMAHEGHGLFGMSYFVAKLALLYTFGEHRAACEVAREAERVIQDYTGTIWDELRVFYHALALSALHGEVAAEERPSVEATLEALRARLAR